MPVTHIRNQCELGCRLAKQGPRTVSHPPAHCDKLAKEVINILQINISGLQNKKLELENMLHQNKIHVALLQETIMPKKEINISGYTQYRCNCTTCQGIMTLIRNDTQANVKNTPLGDVDCQITTLWTKGNTKYTIYNIYCPPASTDDLPLLNPTLKRTIIAGDFNAHIPSLGYKHYNARGVEVEAICNTSNLVLKQNKDTTPTLLHKAHGTTSRPDLTITSADITDRTTIKVMEDIGSDHRPVLTTISLNEAKPTPNRRPSWNFKKANWNRYKQETDAGFGDLNMLDSIDGTYHELCKVILEAAKASIPRGNRKRYKPFWNTELEEAVKERRKARTKAEHEPNIETKREYNRLTAKVRLLSKKAKKKQWTDKCEKLDLKKNGHQAWKLLHNLEGKSQRTNPQPVVDGNHETTNDKKKAQLFNDFFANVNKSQKRKQLDKALWTAAMSQENPKATEEPAFNSPFSAQEMETAVKKLARNKAPGPDGIKKRNDQKPRRKGQEHTTVLHQQNMERGPTTKRVENCNNKTDPEERKTPRPTPKLSPHLAHLMCQQTNGKNGQQQTILVAGEQQPPRQYTGRI